MEEKGMARDRLNDEIENNYCNSSKRKGGKRGKIIIGVLITTVLLILAGFIIWLSFDNGKVTSGVRVINIDLGGMTKAEAKQHIQSKLNEILEHTVTLSSVNKSVDIKLSELGLTMSPDTMVNEAYSIGRTGSLYQRIRCKLNIGLREDFEIKPAWNETVMDETLINRLYEFRVEPVDATWRISADNRLDVVKEKTGKYPDITILTTEISKLNLSQKNSLTIPFQEISPQISSTQLESQKNTGMLSTYSTKFDPGLVGRSENIRLAAQALDSILLKPGEVFSFNQKVGERTSDKGFQTAMIIDNGTFILSIGGGVCQVSSTLYNNVLLADLAVKERYNHDLVITYVPLGQDATVSYPDLDLKFENSSDGYLLIDSQVEEDTLTISLYGRTFPGRKVDITNTLISSTNGLTIDTVRTVSENGKIIKTEDMGKSIYQK